MQQPVKGKLINRSLALFIITQRTECFKIILDRCGKSGETEQTQCPGTGNIAETGRKQLLRDHFFLLLVEAIRTKALDVLFCTITIQDAADDFFLCVHGHNGAVFAWRNHVHKLAGISKKSRPLGRIRGLRGEAGKALQSLPIRHFRKYLLG